MDKDYEDAEPKSTISAKPRLFDDGCRSISIAPYNLAIDECP